MNLGEHIVLIPADFSNRSQKRITIPVELRQPLPCNDLSRYIIGLGHQITCRLLKRHHAVAGIMHPIYP